MADAGYPVSEEVIVNGTDATGAIQEFQVERVTRGFPTITTDHALIHEGMAYSKSDVLASLSQNASTYINFTTPLGDYVHFKPAGFTANAGPIYITLAEGASYTGGTATTFLNMNRLSANTASTTVAIGATQSAAGTTLAKLMIPASSQGAQKLGSSVGAAEERVLKRGTAYGIKILNSSSGAAFVGYDLFMYEEPGA